jgi:hypothetical protein
MAEKSLVNDAVEMLGVDDDEELLLLLDEPPLLELELDELPQAAMIRHAATRATAVISLLFSKCTMTSSSFSPWIKRRCGAAQHRVSRSAAVALIESEATP